MEFNGHIKQQISGAAFGTKCTPVYDCSLMKTVETDFFMTQKYETLV